MDSRTFDALTRGLSSRASRRIALRGIAVGVLGLSASQRAAAQADDAVAVERGCRVRRCRKNTLGQRCTDNRGNARNRNCCQGLKCSRTRGDCVFKNGHGGPGDYCRNSNDCNQGFFCQKNQCLPNTCIGS